MNPVTPDTKRLSITEWLILFVAVIGFAFDIYELLMLPLIVGPALSELVGAAPGSELYGTWVGRLFYIPALAGGIFGLLGGYFTDRFGRRRVLTWSILIYAFGAFAAGFSTSAWMLLFFRCLVFVGVCVEFVAAVAWLAELFPNPHQRERVLGYTQAFSSVGGLMVAYANGLCVQHAAQFPAIALPDWLNFFGGEIKNTQAAWRYTLMTGLIPALPLIIIRPFLPESPAWKLKRSQGTLKRPSLMSLFTPELRRTTLVTTLMFACAYGAAFGAIQHIPRIIPGLSEVKEKASAAVTSAMESQPEADRAVLTRQVTSQTNQLVAANVTKVQELGGLYGRAIMAALAVALLAHGRVSLRSLIGWSCVVSYMVLEVLYEFEGGWPKHLARFGTGLVIGAVAGPLVWGLALIAERASGAGAGKLIRLFQVPGLVVMPIVFAWAAVTSLQALYIGVFLAGLLTVGQFNFWGNYLPRAYPMHLRGTGESFAANIGGRLIGTCFAWVTATLATTPDPAQAPAKLAYAAAGVAFFVYAVGFIASFWLPEPKDDTLPE